jgi:hypothetical protein
MSVSSVASATSSTTLLAASARFRVIIENSDANRLYVLLDSGTASATNFSFSLAQDENAKVEDYHGVIKGIWAGDGSGFAYLTELS